MSSPEIKRGGVVALVIAVLLSGLAAGALWCLLSIVVDSQSVAVLIAFAGAIGLFMRWLGFGDRRGAVGAVVATSLAFVYAEYLFSAVRVANLLGFPLRDTLFRMDLPYAWRLARSDVTWLDLCFLVIACVVAAVATTRSAINARRRRPSP